MLYIPDRVRASSTWHALQLQTTTLFLAITLISFANALAYGEFSELGILALCLALPIGLLSLYGVRSPPSRITLMAMIECLVLMNASPELVQSATAKQYMPFLVVALFIGSVMMLASIQWSNITGLLIAIAADILLYLSNIKWGHATIDVFNVLQGGAEDLMHGRNPYILWYQSTTPHLLRTHFPYNPGALFLAIPGRLVGDIRVSELLAMAMLTLAITLLARRNLPRQYSWWVLAIMLASPFTTHMVVQAWVEVFAMSGLATWLWLRESHPWTSIVVLGFGISASFLILPILVFVYIWHRRMRFEITMAVLVATVITLPFLLWTGATQYLRDVLIVPLSLPWRPDALNLNALWGSAMHTPLPEFVALGIPLTLFAAFLTKGRRSISTSIVMGSLLTFGLILVAKFAFFNYYFIVVCGPILAIALGYGVPSGIRRTTAQDGLVADE